MTTRQQPIEYALLCDPERIDVVDDTVDELPVDEAILPGDGSIIDIDADFSFGQQQQHEEQQQQQQRGTWTELGALPHQ